MYKQLSWFSILWLFVTACSTSGGNQSYGPQSSVAVSSGTISSGTQSPEVADQAGQTLSHRACTGTAKPKFTHLPMNPQDFAFILPYGLMVDGHVTPVDHQYFSPMVFNSKPDTYPVYAMADGQLVDIQTRTHLGQGPNQAVTITDHRLIFSSSCRLFYYYDLITSMAPDVQAGYDASNHNFAVKAGQVIGYIGGQTLDFAVWDTDNVLSGFIVPEHYSSEGWKIYTADPLNYYSDDIKAQALAKYIRVADPRSGKIDYDVDGKLIGTWFMANADGSTTGYSGTGKSDYWTTHLVFAPYFLDPTGFVLSIGNWSGGASQFTSQNSTPDPATVTVDTGLVKYDLVKFHGAKADGSTWDNMTFSTPISLQKESTIQGCMLVQMTDTRKIKAEAVAGKACSLVSGFSSAAVNYIR